MNYLKKSRVQSILAIYRKYTTVSTVFPIAKNTYTFDYPRYICSLVHLKYKQYSKVSHIKTMIQTIARNPNTGAVCCKIMVFVPGINNYKDFLIYHDPNKKHLF